MFQHKMAQKIFFKNAEYIIKKYTHSMYKKSVELDQKGIDNLTNEKHLLLTLLAYKKEKNTLHSSA